MKKFRSVLVLILILSLVMGLGVTASAAGYKVTVLGGTYGVDYPAVTLTEFNPNDFPQQRNVDKYYFKGYHVSGQENNYPGAFTVTQDIILVATWGIQGEMVNYTVRYLLAGTTTEVFPSETRSGNAGDKPIVSARHLDNYLPNTYNYTFTLQKGVTREIVFYYSPAPVVTPAPAQQGNQPPAQPPAQQGNQQQGANANQQQGGQAANNEQPGGNQQTGGQPGTEQPAATAEPTVPEPTAPTEPQEIIDLDNPDVPLAGPDIGEGTIGGTVENNKKNAWLAAGIGGGGLVALLIALWYALVYRKKKNEE